MMKETKELYNQLSEIKDLPILPTVATKLMNLLSDPNSSLKQISNVIISDPSITTKVLKIANSAYYTTTKEISSARMALVIIGQSQISNIVYSLSLFKTFSDIQDHDFQKSFYQHALAVANITKDLCNQVEIRRNTLAYTAGLINEIGLMITNQYFHNYFRLAKIQMEKKDIDSHVAFKEIMGIDHRRVGAWLAEHWKLPNPLISSIMGGSKDDNDDSRKLAAIIQLSKILATLLGFQLIDNFSKEDFIETDAWNQLGRDFDASEKEAIYEFFIGKEDSIKEYVSLLLNA